MIIFSLGDGYYINGRRLSKCNIIDSTVHVEQVKLFPKDIT